MESMDAIHPAEIVDKMLFGGMKRGGSNVSTTGTASRQLLRMETIRSTQNIQANTSVPLKLIKSFHILMVCFVVETPTSQMAGSFQYRR